MPGKKEGVQRQIGSKRSSSILIPTSWSRWGAPAAPSSKQAGSDPGVFGGPAPYRSRGKGDGKSLWPTDTHKVSGKVGHVEARYPGGLRTCLSHPPPAPLAPPSPSHLCSQHHLALLCGSPSIRLLASSWISCPDASLCLCTPTSPPPHTHTQPGTSQGPPGRKSQPGASPGYGSVGGSGSWASLEKLRDEGDACRARFHQDFQGAPGFPCDLPLRGASGRMGTGP